MKKCSIDGCKTRYLCKGFCTKHYQRFIKYGDPIKGVKFEPLRGLSDVDRFKHKYKIDSNTGCWNWQDRLNKWGYGNLRLNNGTSQLAHRYSYALYKGRIPEGLFVCHSCDNPRCVNPDHLWIGTAKDNVQDMVMKGRLNLTIQHKRKGIYKKCSTCKNEMYVTNFNGDSKKYCSYKCMGISYQNNIIKKCIECYLEFTVIKCRKKSAKYCSKDCRLKNLWKSNYGRNRRKGNAIDKRC